MVAFFYTHFVIARVHIGVVAEVKLPALLHTFNPLLRCWLARAPVKSHRIPEMDQDKLQHVPRPDPPWTSNRPRQNDARESAVPRRVALPGFGSVEPGVSGFRVLLLEPWSEDARGGSSATPSERVHHLDQRGASTPCAAQPGPGEHGPQQNTRWVLHYSISYTGKCVSYRSVIKKIKTENVLVILGYYTVTLRKFPLNFKTQHDAMSNSKTPVKKKKTRKKILPDLIAIRTYFMRWLIRTNLYDFC